MKIFRKLALAALLTALLTGACFAGEVFHAAYLQGFPDGSIRPDAAVTRAELAEILYRMMQPEQRQEFARKARFRMFPRDTGRMTPSARWQARG